jgi:hypothetical protein
MPQARLIPFDAKELVEVGRGRLLDAGIDFDGRACPGRQAATPPTPPATGTNIAID